MKYTLGDDFNSRLETGEELRVDFRTKLYKLCYTEHRGKQPEVGEHALNKLSCSIKWLYTRYGNCASTKG